MAFQAIALDALLCKPSISAVDVVRLHDALAYDGPVTEAEARALFAIELSGSTKHATWKDFFIDAIADYAIHQTEPHGYLTALKSDWVLRAAAPRGRVLTPTIFALLETLLSVARWVPERLVAALLDEVYCAVGAGDGPLRWRGGVACGTITQFDCDVVRHVLYCAGSGGQTAIGRVEAEGLLAINSTITARDIPADWTEIFCKAIGDAALTTSGFAGPVREVFLARSMMDGAAPSAAALAKGFGRYRAQAPEDRAISALERQRISIITGDDVRPVTPEWLAAALERHHQPPSASVALLHEALALHGGALAPALQPLISSERATRAA